MRQWTSRGLRALSWPKSVMPHLRHVLRLKFSISTSAPSTISSNRSRPCGRDRSTAMLRLFRFRPRK
ncbi:Uncharacterised protein [Bordetella pertussis]|nr:Uncharacterised protein [Bordetella pertussis]